MRYAGSDPGLLDKCFADVPLKFCNVKAAANFGDTIPAIAWKLGRRRKERISATASPRSCYQGQASASPRSHVASPQILSCREYTCCGITLKSPPGWCMARRRGPAHRNCNCSREDSPLHSLLQQICALSKKFAKSAERSSEKKFNRHLRMR